MEKLIGNKTRTAVFISGRGSNLKSLIKSSKSNKSKFTINLIITNKINAKGLIYAKKNQIPFNIINVKNKKKFENKALIKLKKKSIKLICLAGFMKILSKNFIKSFKYKIINIHPSLLPKYKGLNTHKRVLKNKEKYSGCTVHFVNSELDSGAIILQRKVKISKIETEKSLEKKILRQEHLIYPAALRLITV